VAVELAIAAAKALFSVLLVLQVMALGVFFERKVSALIQDRIGANRASIFGIAALGLVNTLVAIRSSSS
jgi:NADH:ubiquinone oxidoreductase subunit H